MAKFHKMVDMTRSPEEKSEERMKEILPSAIADVPDVPYGLCISLTETELEKLELECDCEIGDTIHLFALAKVTSVSKQDTTAGTKIRVELALTDVCVESEDEENEEAMEDDD